MKAAHNASGVLTSSRELLPVSACELLMLCYFKVKRFY